MTLRQFDRWKQVFAEVKPRLQVTRICFNLGRRR